MSDPLPVALRLKHRLIGKKAALRQVHFPENRTQMLQARKRLAYEEVLRLQIEMMRLRRAETRDGEPTAHVPGQRMDELRAQLPYTLTSEQEQAIADIVDDMTAPRSMNRMLLGDVGTGKTIVAAFALALSADSGCQAAMMAPTQVLARSSRASLGHSSMRRTSAGASSRERPIPRSASGSWKRRKMRTLQVLFGTHALIEPTVSFAHLSLVIIDEQHRFGVNQRAALRMKGPGCDLLVMTATPIPRTLALTLYGDARDELHTHAPGQRSANAYGAHLTRRAGKGLRGDQGGPCTGAAGLCHLSARGFDARTQGRAHRGRIAFCLARERKRYLRSQGRRGGSRSSAARCLRGLPRWAAYGSHERGGETAGHGCLQCGRYRRARCHDGCRGGCGRPQRDDDAR